jgi:hypothetical protein
MLRRRGATRDDVHAVVPEELGQFWINLRINPVGFQHRRFHIDHLTNLSQLTKRLENEITEVAANLPIAAQIYTCSTGAMICGSLFFGELTLASIGHAFISLAGNGIKTSFPASPVSHESWCFSGRMTGIREWISRTNSFGSPVIMVHVCNHSSFAGSFHPSHKPANTNGENCIICWNYLYLSQKLEEITDTESREALLDAVAHGSTVAWRHLDLLGEYDFSAEKLRDSVGIRLPKLGAKKEVFLDLIQTDKPQCTERIR